MPGTFDNIHPNLTKESALRILVSPEEDLEFSSDYYMAVSHLLNFPGAQTEDALLEIAKNESRSQAVRLARRKSLEVLARLGCTRALPVVVQCLNHDDPYLVENAVWALLQLRCQDSNAHQRLIELLEENKANQRVVIHCLAGLDVQGAVEAIQKCLQSPDVSIRSSAGSALCRLTNDRSYVFDLEPSLFSKSQMDRQMVIEDLADCKGIELLGLVLKSPVSPVFRLRFVQAVCSTDQSASVKGFNLVDLLDQILIDSPESLTLNQAFSENTTVNECFEGLFSNDFARCYHCLAKLSSKGGDELWPYFSEQWYNRAFNDYGAHYFFLRLIGFASDWPSDHIQELQELLIDAVNNLRPQFSKSRPIALLSLYALSPEKISSDWLVQILASPNSGWQLQYAALMIAQQSCSQSHVVLHADHEIAEKLASSHPFVKLKSGMF